MGTLEDIFGKLKSTEMTEAQMNDLLILAGEFASLHSDKQDIQDAFGKIKEIIKNKPNSVAQDIQPSVAENLPKISLEEVVGKLGELQKLQDQPDACFKECAKVLSSPQDVTLSEQAVYLLGNVVEKHPEKAEQALEIMDLCKDNKQLAAIDSTMGDEKYLIGSALFYTTQKIIDVNPALKKRALDSVLSYEITLENAHPKQPATKEQNKQLPPEKKESVMSIDENKLPKLRLGGANGITYDLAHIKEELNHLKAGESLSLGRSPALDKKDVSHIQVGADNLYVSRHHCDIRRDEYGKLELVDLSTSGTKILPPEEKENVMSIDENKLPKLRLGGANGITYDLAHIKEELNHLKAGESLSLGRSPTLDKKDVSHIQVGADNLYVSRHHCDIRRNEYGKLELVDLSTNGTKILPPEETRQKPNDEKRPPAETLKEKDDSKPSNRFSFHNDDRPPVNNALFKQRMQGR